MRFRLWSLLLSVVVSVVASELPAQCSKVSFKKYGTTCAFFTQHASLDGSYDAASCTATFKLGWSRTCCNTFLSQQIIFLSAVKIDPGLRHPLLVQGCLLSVFPHIVIPLPRSAGGVLRLPVPSVPVKFSVYLQGLNDYFTTISRRHDFQTSQGLQMDIT